MRYRTFGATDLEVSEICYGTMRYASKDGKRDERAADATRALQEAVDAGINFFHSSHEYGTRWLTGEVLGAHPKRHELHHIIKVNVPDWGDQKFDASTFRGNIEDALRELKVERIAVVQHLHRGTLPRELGYCAEGEPKRLSEFDEVTNDLLEEFEKLREAGKVGYLTTFPYTTGYAQRAIESGSFSGVVAYFNALETEMAEFFAEMERAGMGFIGIRPFAAGLLTDPRIDRENLPEDDRMRDPQWDRLYDQLTELKNALGDEQASWTRFAIQFSLIHPVITSTVVGINTPAQLQSVIEAVEGHPLNQDVLSRAHQVCRQFREQFGVKGSPAGVPVY